METLSSWYQFKSQMQAQSTLQNACVKRPAKVAKSLLDFDVETRWKQVLKNDVVAAFNAVTKNPREENVTNFLNAFSKLRSKMVQFSWSKQFVETLINIPYKQLRKTYFTYAAN